MKDATPLFRKGAPLFLMAGPCVLEDDSLNLRVATALAELSAQLDLPVIFKASFDKANRTRASSPRGPGLDKGLEQLALVRRESGLPVVSDIHEAWQADPVAEVCDVLQIPAFLCRQTDLISSAAATGRPLNIKKGQWLSPESMAGAAEKARAAGAESLAFTERGSFYGYGDLVVDMRSFQRMRAVTGARMIFDGTHSVQQPAGCEAVSGGQPSFTPLLVRAAVAAGTDGLFLEVHPEPENAPCDGSNMLCLNGLRRLLEEALRIRAALEVDRMSNLAEPEIMDPGDA